MSVSILVHVLRDGLAGRNQLASQVAFQLMQSKFRIGKGLYVVDVRPATKEDQESFGDDPLKDTTLMEAFLGMVEVAEDEDRAARADGDAHPLAFDQ